MPFDKAKFAAALIAGAQPRSLGECAHYVREAMIAAGLNTDRHPVFAKDYGSFLVHEGFGPIPDTEIHAVGDIVVFGGNQFHPYGHVAGCAQALAEGEQAGEFKPLWISDFKQHWYNPYVEPDSAGPHQFYRYIDPADDAGTQPEGESAT